MTLTINKVVQGIKQKNKTEDTFIENSYIKSAGPNFIIARKLLQTPPPPKKKKTQYFTSSFRLLHESLEKYLSQNMAPVVKIKLAFKD